MTGEFDDGEISAFDNALMWCLVISLLIGGIVMICLE